MADVNVNESSSNEVRSIKDLNKHTGHDHTYTSIPCESNICNDKISNEGDCLYQGSYTINASNNSGHVCGELIDFEAIIDSISNHNAIQTLHDNIKEFETVLNSFEPSSAINVDDDLNLNDINDFIKTLDTESENINSQEVSDIHTYTCTSDCSENNNDVTDKSTIESAEIDTDTPDNDKSLQENNTTTHTSPVIAINNDDLIEIISVSSEHSQSSDDDGYNSSDFEFITETEAYAEGYIIKFNKNIDFESKIKATHSERDDFENKSQGSKNEGKNISHFNCEAGPSGLITSNRVSHSYNQENNTYQDYSDQNNNRIGYADPGEGSSGLRLSNRPYRPNHVVPDEEEYLDLFRGPYDPVLPLSDIIFMENKSTRPLAMNVHYEGIGFEQQLIGRRYQPDSSEEEHADEAKESAKKIVSMYPGENRRRRGRRH